jgi:hypothetical protein
VGIVFQVSKLKRVKIISAIKTAVLIDGKVPQSFIFVSCCGKMLKKSYILNFIIDAKFSI